MTQKVFLAVLFLYVLGFSLHALYLHKTVYGDGIYYYSWMRSILVDRDINFSNEYSYFHASQPTTPLAIPGNKYSIGPAVLWAPWFLWTHILVRGSGYEFPYQFIVGLSSVLYGIFGLVLLYGILNKYFGRLPSLAGVVAIAGATNLLFYGSLDTVNSHAVSFFAAALFLTFLFQKPKNWLLIGASLGLCALVRTQDLAYGALLVPNFIRTRLGGLRFQGEALKKIVMVFCGLLIAFLPQLVAWQLLYGKFWISPYLGTLEGFDFLHPHIVGVLFSLQNGLILWTPIVAIGFVGLWLKSKLFPAKLMALIVLLQLFVIASWSTWWQGASYSGRMFVSSLPLVAIGLSNFFTKIFGLRFRALILFAAIIIPLSLINLLLIVFFLLKQT